MHYLLCLFEQKHVRVFPYASHVTRDSQLHKYNILTTFRRLTTGPRCASPWLTLLLHNIATRT